VQVPITDYMHSEESEGEQGNSIVTMCAENLKHSCAAIH
jgi:hypothetical protein